MTVITYRHRPKRKRPAKPTQAAAITGARIVSYKSGKRHATPQELPPNAEADARVAEFFARMIQPLPEEQK
jgi:hypothetical protein